MYYEKRFDNKPNVYETAIIQGYKDKKSGTYHEPLIIPTTIDIKDLAEGLSNGATFKPAFLNGTKSKNWVQQQLFALDFDHDTTIDEQIEKCKALNIYPVFGYTSFSHSEQEHHFRLVFCNDKVITDFEKRNKLQLTMIHIFDKSDKVTYDSTRLFYGGKQLISFDFNNQIDADNIINTYWNDSYAVDNNRKKAKQPKAKTNSNVTDKSEQCVVTHDNNMKLKVEAIKRLNVDVIKSLLKVHTDKEDNIPSFISMHFQFKSQQEVYDYINSIDLQEYLGVYGYVNCILPEHEDHSPSAHIYTTDDGTQIYKCLGCNKAYTIISITEKLARCKRSEAIEFIKKVYNIELVESDWTKQWKQKMIDSASYLDSEDFKLTNPILCKLIRTRKTHIQAILIYLTQYVNEDMQIDGKPIFFASYDKLLEVCGLVDRNKLSQTLILFSLLNMIIKLELTDIPEKPLNKAKHIAALYNHNKLTNFYSVEEYGVNLLEPSEEIAKTLIANNMTFKGLCREYVLRTFGTELADKIFPQYKFENKQGTSQKSDECTLQIEKCLFYCIEQKGYATEKDIVHLMGDKYKYQTTEIQIKKSLQEILMTYNLVRVKASKANKAQYNIDDDISYQSYIICRKLD